MSSVTGQAHGIGAAQASARSAPRVDGDDALGAGGRRRVDGRDAGVGVRAADDGEVQGAGDVEVGGEAGLAGEQGGVLAAQHGAGR